MVLHVVLNKHYFRTCFTVRLYGFTCHLAHKKTTIIFAVIRLCAQLLPVPCCVLAPRRRRGGGAAPFFKQSEAGREATIYHHTEKYRPLHRLFTSYRARTECRNGFVISRGGIDAAPRCPEAKVTPAAALSKLRLTIVVRVLGAAAVSTPLWRLSTGHARLLR